MAQQKRKVSKAKRASPVKPKLNTKLSDLSGPAHKYPVTEFTTEELLRELHRRSTGFYGCVVSIGDRGQDEWRFIMKGSTCLLHSMGALLSVEFGNVVGEDDDENLAG